MYVNFNFPGFTEGSKTLVTGIRQRKHNIYITGFYVPPAGKTVSFLYKGHNVNHGAYYMLNYPDPNVVTNLYGPNVLKDGNVRVVGNIASNGNVIGCMYTGPLDGSGKWKLLNIGANTICHSTMGNYVVGNYTNNSLGKAFLYNIRTKNYIDIVKSNAKSITAYGIWDNKDGTYTICGGYSPLGSDKTIAYTVKYHCKKHKFYKWKDYYYNNDTSASTHFNGISGNNLTGVAIVNSTSYAFKLTTCNNKWTTISYPGSDTTTGNSIADNIVIGVYTVILSSTVNSYVYYG